jgi:sec-independent protein translocase protein TatA
MLSSPVEWGIVAAAALLLFGPKKFPEIGRSLGQGIGNFKKALNDAQDQVVAGTEKGSEKSSKKAPKATAAVADRKAAADEAESEESTTASG